MTLQLEPKFDGRWITFIFLVGITLLVFLAATQK